MARIVMTLMLLGLGALPAAHALGADTLRQSPGQVISLLPDQQDASPAFLHTSLLVDDGSGTSMQVGLNPEFTDNDQTWVLVAPYLWLPAMNGSIEAKGVSVPIDVSLSDAFELATEDLNGAFMGHVEVGKGNYGLIFDAMLMQLNPTETLPLGGRASIETGTTLLEGLGMVRLVNMPSSDQPGPALTVDLIGGARYYEVLNEISITPIVGPTIRVDATKDWVDLVVGGRTMFEIMPGLNGFFRGDIGGFGWGTSSKLAWNINTGVEYACPAVEGSSLIMGYRILSIDETQKSGADQFTYDVLMHGPFAALGFRF